MGQLWRQIAAMWVIAIVAGCDRAPAPAKAASAKHPTIASMVPAATDILLGIGAGDHLVAVSNYDTANPGAVGLPRVGDYQNTDWEKLAALKPDVLVIQMNEASVPEGLKARAAQLGARLVNVRINTLAEIEQAMTQLGQVAGEPDLGQAGRAVLEHRLDMLRTSAAGGATRALIVLDDSGKGVVGPGGFLDDLLTAAGGENVAKEIGKPYATLDGERIAAMNPSVIIQLLPGYPPAELERAKRAWDSMPNVAAVKEHRVYAFTDWYVLLPGPHVADLAEQMAGAMHAKPATRAAP